MTDQRIAELLRLRRKVDAELARLALAAEPSKIKRRSKFDIPDCGTESGYQRHRYYNEPKTDCGCAAAHAAHEREQSAIRQARKIADRLAETRRTA